MEKKTVDRIPPQLWSCTANHDLLAHRCQLTEEFLLQTFSTLYRRFIEDNCNWRCCGENINPGEWPILAQITGWVAGNSSGPAQTSSSNGVTVVVPRPPVITHTASTLANNAVQNMLIDVDSDSPVREEPNKDVEPFEDISRPETEDENQPKYGEDNGFIAVEAVATSSSLPPQAGGTCVNVISSILPQAIIQPATQQSGNRSEIEKCGNAQIIQSDVCQAPSQSQQIPSPVFSASNQEDGEEVIVLSSDEEEITAAKKTIATPRQETENRSTVSVHVQVKRNPPTTLMGIGMCTTDTSLAPISRTTSSVPNNEKNLSVVNSVRQTRSSRRTASATASVTPSATSLTGTDDALTYKSFQKNEGITTKTIIMATKKQKGREPEKNQTVDSENDKKSPGTSEKSAERGAETSSTSETELSSEFGECEDEVAGCNPDPRFLAEAVFTGEDGDGKEREMGRASHQQIQMIEEVDLDGDEEKKDESEESTAVSAVSIIDPPSISLEDTTCAGEITAANSSAINSSLSAVNKSPKGSCGSNTTELLYMPSSEEHKSVEEEEEEEPEGGEVTALLEELAPVEKTGDLSNVSSSPPLPVNLVDPMSASSANSEMAENDVLDVDLVQNIEAPVIPPLIVPSTRDPPSTPQIHPRENVASNFKQWRSPSKQMPSSNYGSSKKFQAIAGAPYYSTSTNTDTPSEEDEPPMETVLLETNASTAASAVIPPLATAVIQHVEVHPPPQILESPVIVPPSPRPKNEKINTGLHFAGYATNPDTPLSELVVPRRSCTQKDQYRCKCQKRFATKEELEVHREIHNDSDGKERNESEGEEGRIKESGQRRSNRKKIKSTRMKGFQLLLPLPRDNTQTGSCSESEDEEKDPGVPSHSQNVVPSTGLSDSVAGSSRLQQQAEEHVPGIPTKRRPGRPRKIDRCIDSQTDTRKKRFPVKQRSSCSHANKTDRGQENSSDEEPLNMVKERQARTRQRRSEQKKRKIRVTASSEERLAKMNMDYSDTGGENSNMRPTKKPRKESYTDLNEPVASISVTHANSDLTAAENSSSKEQSTLVGNDVDNQSMDIEDLDATQIVDIPSGSCSQASTETTAASPSPRKTSSLDKSGPSRVPCECGRVVSVKRLHTHRSTPFCQRRREQAEQGLDGYEGGEDSQTEAEDPPSKRRSYVRDESGTKPKEKCLYCGREMLTTSIRAHVKNVCPEARKPRKEKSESQKNANDFSNLIQAKKMDECQEAKGGGRQAEGEVDSKRANTTWFNSPYSEKEPCKHCGKLLTRYTLAYNRHLCKSRIFSPEDTTNDNYNAFNKEPVASSSVKSMVSARSTKTPVNYAENDSEEELILISNGVRHEEAGGTDGQENEVADSLEPEPEDQYCCEFEDCLHMTDTEDALRNHMTSEHLQSENYPCDFIGCNRKFVYKKNYNEHRKDHIPHFYPDPTMTTHKLDPRLQPQVRIVVKK